MHTPKHKTVSALRLFELCDLDIEKREGVPVKDAWYWNHNYSDAIMSAMPSQITGCSLNRLFRRRTKKTSKLRVSAMAVDVLNPLVARSSVAMSLTILSKRVLVFHKEEFQLPLPPECWGIMENANTTKPNLNVSRLVLQLSLLNPLKPGVTSRIEDAVGAAPTGGAPTTFEWSANLLSTKLRLILDVRRYILMLMNMNSLWQGLISSKNIAYLLATSGSLSSWPKQVTRVEKYSKVFYWPDVQGIP